MDVVNEVAHWLTVLDSHKVIVPVSILDLSYYVLAEKVKVVLDVVIEIKPLLPAM